MITGADIDFFELTIGQEHVFTDEETRLKYGKDETENLSFPADVVLKPSCTSEISNLLKYCNERKIAVTAIGAQTGLSGGALCVRKGVALSTERLNKILKIDTNNGQVHTEPAVITQVLQEECAKQGLYYAPDPASRGSCWWRRSDHQL